MENDLVQLIKKIQNRNSEDGFEVSNLQITSIDPKVEFVSISYNGEDLTEVREVEVHISGGNAEVYGYPTEEEMNLS